MKTQDLDFKYSPTQVATRPSTQFQAVLGAAPGASQPTPACITAHQSKNLQRTQPQKNTSQNLQREKRHKQGPCFLSKAQVFDLFAPGDVLVVNNTQVLKRSLSCDKGDILFLQPMPQTSAQTSPHAAASSSGQTSPHAFASSSGQTSPHAFASSSGQTSPHAFAPTSSQTVAPISGQTSLQSFASKKLQKSSCQTEVAQPQLWQVLCETKKHQFNHEFLLPGDVKAQFIKKGRPQILRVEKVLDENYFNTYARFALPPYILKARRTPSRSTTTYQDATWYQNPWAEENVRAGSLAAPTASLHFNAQDLMQLKKRGIHIAYVTLHIGVGTFLPIQADKVEQHQMHKEFYFIPDLTQQIIQSARQQGGRVWALGTTVVRCLESWPLYGSCGESELFIHPGFRFQVVDALLTNFHQPRSSLLALVMAFAGRQELLQTYQWAYKNKCPLFSYGALSVWPQRKGTA